MGSRFRGNDDWGAAPTWDGGEGEGRGGWVPASAGTTIGGRPYVGRRGGRGGWVPAFAGTTDGGSRLRGMGDRLRAAPHLWIPAPYRGTGHAFAGMTDGGSRLRRSVEAGEGPPPGRPWVPAFAGTTIGEPAPGFPLARERRLGSPPLGSRFRGNDDWGAAPGFPLSRERRLGVAPGFPLSRERRLGSPPLGSRFRGNDGWGSPLRRGPPRTGRDHARSTVWAKVAARAQGPACGESCRVSGQTSAALWLPAGTAPLLRILPGWGSLYRQCTTRHH